MMMMIHDLKTAKNC